LSNQALKPPDYDHGFRARRPVAFRTSRRDDGEGGDEAGHVAGGDRERLVDPVPREGDEQDVEADEHDGHAIDEPETVF
jgi:hypothetical protein